MQKTHIGSCLSNMKIYRIRDTVTGLFSKGGADANTSHWQWGKTGKIWKGIGPLRSHLNQFLPGGDAREKGIPTTWEVLEYEVVETQVSARPVHEIIDSKKIINILKS